MKNFKKILIVVLLLCACFVSVGKVSAATLSAPKIKLTKEKLYLDGTIDVAYVKNASIYQVYRSTNKKKWTKIGILHVEGTYLDDTGAPNTTYYYKVRACDLNDKCGKWSNIVSKKATLDTPKDLSINNIGDTVGISWVGSYNATGYEVQRSTDNKKWGETKKTEYVGYYDSDVKYNKVYYYRVRAYKKINNKKYTSKWSSIKVDNKKPTIKDSRYVVGDNGITLIWKGTTSYIVEVLRSTKENGTYEKVLSKDVVGSEGEYFARYYDETGKEVYILDNGLKANTTYYYKLRYVYYIDGKEMKGKQVKFKVKTSTLDKAKKAAVKTAKELVNKKFYGYSLSYSKKELINILQEDYGYSKKAATYGVEQAKINFKKQALNLAKSYTGSEKEISNVLKESGYTKSEVNYAMKNAKNDYNANARTKESYYLENDGLSKKDLVNRLTEALFTKKQVKNGSKNVNYKLQALISAAKAVENNLLSKTGLKNHLIEYKKYTEEEADYAVKKSKIDYVQSAITYVKDNWKNDGIHTNSREEDYNLLKKEYSFSKKDANKILDGAAINYKKKAIFRANDVLYSDTKGYSKESLKTYLINTAKFTEAEAKYAVKNGGFDYSDQAAKYALCLLENGTTDKDEITKILKDEKFTDAEIEYALVYVTDILA